MTLMQKAITPALSHAYLTAGHDRLAGYVVRAADVSFATTPSQLFEVHGLGYPESPFSPHDEHIIMAVLFASLIAALLGGAALWQRDRHHAARPAAQNR